MKSRAHRLLNEHYGITGNLKRLNAYASENYLVISGDNKFVFKIYINNDNPLLIQSENEILLALNSSNRSLNLPCPVKTKNGEYQFAFQEKESHYIIRLLTYIEGTFLAEMVPDKMSYKSLGIYLASLDHELLKLKNPIIESRKFQWNIGQLYLVEEKIKYINEPSRQNLVRHFILQYNENVGQYNENVGRISHQLRHSIIHNDCHEWNILTNKNQVTSLIDFGDIVYMPH